MSTSAPRRCLRTSIPTPTNVDPDAIANEIGPRTKAILPVDQLGMPCEIDAILDLARHHDLLVIQDAACAIGTRFRDRPIGGIAPITVFSLHARKVVTTGEGGMILTDDAALAARLRMLRHQGMSLSDFERHVAQPTKFETYPELGYNFRITDIQAAIGVCQLDRLDDLLARRRKIATRYILGLSKHPFVAPPHVPAHVTPNWQSFQVRVRPESPLARNALMEHLHAKGIATRRGVMASHVEPPYRSLGYQLPATGQAAAVCLQLPMHAGMTEADAALVLSTIDRVYSQYAPNLSRDR